MNKPFPILLTLLLLSQLSLASQLVSPDATIKGDEAQTEYVDMAVYCQTQPCRKNVHFKLRLEGGQIDEQAAVYWPVVQGDRISVLANETVKVTAQQQNQRLRGFKTADQSEPAMTFELRQNEDDLGMMLVVSNPFDYPIKLSIDLIDFEGNLHPTSSCPVMAGGKVYEMWSHPIPELLISNIRQVSDQSFNCEY